jgi:hypothetical protein
MEEQVYTVTPVTHKCVHCGKEVGSEPNDVLDHHGHVVRLYSPASRYWISRGHPSKTEGVLCSPECALDDFTMAFI